MRPHRRTARRGPCWKPCRPRSCEFDDKDDGVGNGEQILRERVPGAAAQVGAHIELKDVDIYCFDLISRHGPPDRARSPGAPTCTPPPWPAFSTDSIAAAGSPAAVTRTRPTGRAVTVRALRDRNAELFQLHATMNASVDEICADYTDHELGLLTDFLRRTSAGGRDATDRMAGD